MTHDEQLKAFAGDLHDLIARYGKEFDLNAMAVCGVLLYQIRRLQDQVMTDDSEPPPTP